ncbi:MAG: flagellar export protein FliJ [Candidatus Berkiella sp.]
MKDDLIHLKKYQFVLETQEEKILHKISEIQKKQDAEMRKYNMLKQCLVETRNNLLSQGQALISAISFQQFQNFINQLEKALAQQSEVMKAIASNLEKQMIVFKEIKFKRKKLDDLISKKNQEIHFQLARRENQENTELFNRLNRFK